MGLPEFDQHLTIGVEEEFLLIDTRTRVPAPCAPAVLAELPADRDRVQFEFSRYQVEINTPVCHTIAEVSSHLERLRARLVTAAGRHHAQPIATGTPIVAHPVPPARVDLPRYHRIAQAFGILTDTLTVCGCHVHIGLPDRAIAVEVSNHLRPWLPILLALSANSPFFAGRDTGYASWRAVSLCRWPGGGIPPRFDSVADYDRAVDWLIDSGAALDRGMVYWHVRPSHHLPTLEIRIFDAPATADEAVLFAALSRALVSTALCDIRAGREAPSISDHDLQVAVWCAARTGLTGACLNPASGGFTPAGELLGGLLDHLRPALRASGDLDFVADGLDSLRRSGSGACRQRLAFADRGSIADVVDLLSRHMVGTASLPIPTSRAPEH